MSIKLMIVDDHMLFREGLAGIMQREPGIDVVGLAGSVEEAVEMASVHLPDVILMDFGLPDGSGVDATKAILATQPGIKIIFLTIHEDDQSLKEAVRGGAKGFLTKDINPAKLVASIRSVCRGEAALSRSMTYRLMDAFTHEPEKKPADENILFRLTQREREILVELATGATNRQISERLYLTENTVKHHLHSILTKIGISDRKEAAKFARENGLLLAGHGLIHQIPADQD